MREPRAPRLWTVAAAALLAGPTVVAAASLLFGLVRAWVRPSGAGRDEAARAWLVTLPGLGAQVTTASLVLLAFATFGAWLSPRPARQSLSLDGAPVRARDALALSLAVTAFGVAYSSASALAGVGDRGTLATFARAVRSASATELACAYLLIAVVPAVCEELFFRGYVLTRLAERLDARAASIASGVAFGAFHMDLHQGLAAALMGAGLARATLALGSVRLAMIAHTVNNAAALTALYLMPLELAPRSHAAIGAAALAVSLTSAFALVRLRSALPACGP